MNYKVGDTVRIREDLEMGECQYGGCYIANEMTNYAGRIAYIREVTNNCYYLDVDNKEWGWTDAMLEPVEVNNKNRKNTYEYRNMKYILDGDKTIVIQYYIDKDDVKRYRKGVSKKHPLDVYNEGIGMIYAIANAYGINKKFIHIGECKCRKNENNINKNKEEKELEFIKKFKEEKIAINCATVEETEHFKMLLQKYNFGQYDFSFNRDYKDHTCYTYNFNDYHLLQFASNEFYASQGWEIIQYKDIFKKDIDLTTIYTEDLLEELKKRVK